MIDKGLHPLKIADGFDRACDIAIKRLDEISVEINIDDNEHETLVEAAMIALGSKVVNNYKRELAKIAV